MSTDLTQPIAYLQRIEAYYRALGYGEPYRFARFDDAPFATMRKPLHKARLALVTTAAPFKPGLGNQGPGAAYNAAAKFYEVYAVPIEPPPDLRISHVAYDRKHTSAEDPGTWLPLEALKEAAREGRIGALTPRVYGLPTNRSQRTSIEKDAPALHDLVQADLADSALLVANCPVCHQSIALAARHLEANGIPTVVMGCAKDIVEQVGVARFLFSDFPLGNAAGRPHDLASQHQTLAMALELLETATGPRTTRQSPLTWPGDPAWKLDYSNAERMTAAEIAEARLKFDAGKEVARRLREHGSPPPADRPTSPSERP
jgi:glycine/betaine/sarcosine/D-proline reductase family selenoprotein B